MPNLNNHGLGGAGKSLGIPVYPFETVEGIIEDDNGTLDAFYATNVITTAPEKIQGQASCQIDEDMYFIGTATNNAHCFKYNLRTKIWTRLTDSPYGANDKDWAVPIETNIYYGVGNLIVKYDTVKNTHSSLGTFRYFKGSRATTDGEYIYISGGNYSSSYNKMMNRFNPVNNEFLTLAELPLIHYNHSMAYYSDYIYLYGSPDSNVFDYQKYVYRYDTKLDEYLSYRSLPVAYSDGIILTVYTGFYEKYHYLISSNNKVIRHDLFYQTYSELSDTPNGRYSGHAGFLDGVIYLIGGGDTDGDTVMTGDAMKVIEAIADDVVVQRLGKGVKVHTDGNVIGGTILDFNGKAIIDDITTLEKVNGVVRIPTDGDYAIVGGNYATIGG